MFGDTTGHVRAIREADAIKGDPIRITKRDEELDSAFSLRGSHDLVIASLAAPELTNVDYMVEGGQVRVDLQTPKGGLSSAEIGTGGTFQVSGRNIVVSGNEAREDYELVTVEPGEVAQTVFLSPADSRHTVVASLDCETGACETLLGDLRARNVSFVELDLSRRFNREASTILSGRLQIAGTDIFKKRFLISERQLEPGDFIDLNDNDVYIVTSMKLAEGRLVVSLYSQDAKGLALGKRPGLLRSAFPSLLDVMVAEPAKKSLWLIAGFLMSQFGAISRLFAKLRPSAEYRSK